MDRFLQRLVERVNGSKTYIAAAIVGLIAAARFLGWIDDSTALTLFGLFGAGGMAALRSAVSKLAK